MPYFDLLSMRQGGVSVSRSASKTVIPSHQVCVGAETGSLVKGANLQHMTQGGAYCSAVEVPEHQAVTAATLM